MYAHHQPLMELEKKWVLSETPPPLPNQEVHIWRLRLDQMDSQVSLFWDMLSGDEKIRAAKFRFEKDKNHYILTRGVLRNLLGKYLNITAQKIQFDYNAFGKPSLKNSQGLQFNLSHKSGFALLAFTQKKNIGIDLEKINPTIAIEKLAARFFSKKEAETLFSIEKELRAKSFFYCWTRKEAFIKGHGEGLSLPLGEFEVSILESEEVRLEKVNWNPKEVKEWSLISFEPFAEMVGAVAVEGEVERLKFLELET